MKLQFKDEAECAELKIYDTIGDDGWGGGITTAKVEEELNKANGKPLNIYINSCGGEVFEGFAIYNMLNRYAGYKTVYVDGIAASIASVIALCGNKVIMNKASMFMIHNASGACIGNAEDMKKVIQALEQINEVIKDVYKARTNLDEQQLTDLMDKETFLTAEECLAYGFCDEINEEEQDTETLTNMKNSMELLKNTIEDKLKLVNDLKVVSQGVIEDSVDDETLTNKQAKYNWLRF